MPNNANEERIVIPELTENEKRELREYTKGALLWKNECGKALQYLKESVSEMIWEELAIQFPDHVAADEQEIQRIWGSLQNRYGSYTRTADKANQMAVFLLKTKSWTEIEGLITKYRNLAAERLGWNTGDIDYSIPAHEKMCWLIGLIQTVPEMAIMVHVLQAEAGRNLMGTTFDAAVTRITEPIRTLKESDQAVNNETNYDEVSYIRSKHRINPQTSQGNQNSRTDSGIKCYRCGRMGHKEVNCRVTLSPEQKQSNNQRSDYKTGKRKYDMHSPKSEYSSRKQQARQELLRAEVAYSEALEQSSESDSPHISWNNLLEATEDDN
jgi:hypothetical protein